MLTARHCVSAGGDLDWIQAGRQPSATMAAMREGRDTVTTMIECDTPVIAAIHGVAVGHGSPSHCWPKSRSSTGHDIHDGQIRTA